MIITEDFQFADNAAVNSFAEERANLMFGKDWKNRPYLELSCPSLDQSILCDNQTGLSLETTTMHLSSPRYAIRCRKNLAWCDPAANVAAESEFYPSGRLSYQAHYTDNCAINPPDGTPSQIDYDTAGHVSLCRYVHPDGNRFCDPASKTEVSKRIARARQTMVAGLCDGGQDVVALASGKSRHQQQTKASQRGRESQKR